MKICLRVERQRDVHVSQELIKLSSRHVTFTVDKLGKIGSPDDGLGSIELQPKDKVKTKGLKSIDQPIRSQLSTFRIDFDIAILLQPNGNLISDVAHTSVARRVEDVAEFQQSDVEQKYLFVYDLEYRGNAIVKNPQVHCIDDSLFAKDI